MKSLLRSYNCYQSKIQQSYIYHCEVCNLLNVPTDIKCCTINFNRDFLPFNLRNAKEISICKQCRKKTSKNQCPPFAEINGLQLSAIPDELNSLNHIELQLIALVRPLLAMCNVVDKRGHKTQLRQKSGVVVFVPVPIEGTIETIKKSLPADSNLIIEVNGKNIPTTLVQIEKVFKALNYLKSNNSIYADIRINTNFNLFDNKNVCFFI